MKHHLIALFLIVALHSAGISQGTWKASDYKPEAYRKVMVLAKISDLAARKQLEDYTVKYLSAKGIDAMTAYGNISKSNTASRETFLAKADSLKVDALLVYEVNGAEKRVESTPTLSVGVGVGMYGGFSGAYVPIAGGAKMVTGVKLSVYFYNRASKDEQWANELSGTLDGPTDKLANTFAKTTVKALLKDGMFILKK